MSNFKANFEDDSQGLSLNKNFFLFLLHFLQKLIYNVKWLELVTIYSY